MDFKLAFTRLTGRHVLGPGVFWSTLAFGLLAHALGSADLGSGNILDRVLGVFASHLALIAGLYTVRWATFRLTPSAQSLAIVVIGYMLAGALRGEVLQFVLYLLGEAETSFSIFRLVGGVVVMGSGLLWAAYTFGLKAEWGAKRANLSATKQQLESLLAASETRLEMEATDTLSTIESMLQTALIPELMLSPQKALSKLQSLINDTLRPLSASLVANQPRIEVERLDPSAYKFRWRTLLTHLNLRDASRPLTLALILSVLAINGFVQYISDVNPGFLFLTAFFVMATPLAISRWVLARWVDRLRNALRVPTTLAILFSIGFGGGMAVLELAENQSIALSLSINAAVAATLLGVLFGIERAASIEMASIEAQLTNYEHRLRWTIAKVNGQHWMQKKQFARKIHGPIQSEVAAAAIRIERSLHSGEITESGEVALQNLRDRLANLLDDTKGTSDVRPVLAEISETWQGLCEIDVTMNADVEQALKRDSVCVETVLEIAREACSNAIRHGAAETIDLVVEFETLELVKITVRNDGAKSPSGSRRGVGSAYLDDCTYRHDLTHSEDCTVLTATVPYRAI